MLTPYIIQQLLCDTQTLIPVYRRTLEMLSEETITALLEETLQMYIDGTELKNDGSNEPRTWGGSFLKALKKTEHAHYIFKGY